MTELRLTTTALDAGQRLDRLLSQAAPELSRAALQKAVQAGHCQIDGLPETRADAKIRAGQTIVLCLPATSTTLQAEEGHWLRVMGLSPGTVATEMQVQSASLRFSGMENIPLLDADIFFILLRANSPAIARQRLSLRTG